MLPFGAPQTVCVFRQSLKKAMDEMTATTAPRTLSHHMAITSGL